MTESAASAARGLPSSDAEASSPAPEALIPTVEASAFEPEASEASLLDRPERHPLVPSEAALALGPTLVAAPHPDDEALGCGGLLALLARGGVPAHVAFVTDGSRSHPGSAAYPPRQLAALREAEAREAVRALGLPPDAAHFLRYPDCGLPDQGTEAFQKAAAEVAGLIRALRPRTLVLPWRRDPHCDHEATWALFKAALARLAEPPRVLEYPVWAWPSPRPEVRPRDGECGAWRLDIAPVLEAKREAIAAHRSQTTGLITDSPEGFRLSPAMLALFSRPWELFIGPPPA